MIRKILLPRNSENILFFSLTAILLLCFILTMIPVEGTAVNLPNSKDLSFNKDIQEKLAKARMNEEFLKTVRNKLSHVRNHELFQKKIREYPAFEKISAFLKTLKKAPNAREVLQSLNLQKKSLAKVLAPGGIQGTVTVDGMPPLDWVEVLAFDSYGFYAGSGMVDYYGSYIIMDLPAGEYYVITQSYYVDEFFDNVVSDLYANWRSATLVTVAEDLTTTGINFELDQGAKVTGTIYDETVMMPLSYSYIDFEISDAVDPDILFTPWSYTDEIGFYQITVPATGSFKIKSNLYGYENEYYNNQTDWLSANSINISTLDDSIPNIDFSLGVEVPPVVDEGAKIQGIISGPEAVPVNQALVFAFDVEDTSIVGFTMSGTELGEGEYEIMGLEPGSYILYANHYLDFMAPPPVKGAYYPDVDAPDEASVVDITQEKEIITDININLGLGGNISGNITNASEVPLDSVIVLAIKSDMTLSDKFFIDEIDIGLALSDEFGNYEVAGLSSGEYTLRTISLLGPHAGLVLDEYYENVPSLFDFDLATSVTVTAPNTTNPVDFVLDFAGAISGNFFEFNGVDMVQGEGVVIAFNALTDLPELAFPIYNPDDGSYQLQPLPTGSFKLLAFVVNEETEISLDILEKRSETGYEIAQNGDEIIYLPQFYNGKYSFDDANAVNVTAATITSNIDFKMIRTGTIQGFVYYEAGEPAGADKLAETLVAAFDAASGDLRGANEITFSGGYRIHGLPPGAYKVIALPASDGYAGTYYGGGTSFDHENSENIIVLPNETTEADITLVQGQGTITGIVDYTDANGMNKNLNGCFVIAYDQTGHAVSGGVTPYVPDFPGVYKIEGLVAGDYYVRTFTLPAVIALLEGLLGGDMAAPAPVGFLPTGLSNQDEITESLEIEIFIDEWYDDIPVEINIEEIDLMQLFFNLLYMSDEEVPFFLPFFSVPLAEAEFVSVSSPGTTFHKDFHLQLFDIGSIVGDISDGSMDNAIPSSYQLAQNYPNPFNPITVISWQLAVGSDVDLSIYNVLGQKVATLVSGKQKAGFHTVEWDASGMASGVYYYKMFVRNSAERKGEFQQVRKMILLR